MGDSLILFYKNKVKPSWKAAFFTTFVAFLLIHIYKFTNTLPNHDSLFNVYVNQDMTVSGRWFLQFACGISSYFDLPWINGMLCAVYMALTTAVITELFDLNNPVVISLSGLILAACPATTETLFFGFTADGYFLGLLLSAVAACLSCKASKSYHFLGSGICICLSCAIYQAYISFAVVLSACFLITKLLEQQISVRDAWKWIGKHTLLYVISLAVYYLLWKIILAVSGQVPTGYQGISTVGKISFATLINGSVCAFKNLFFFFFEWNILEHPVSLYAILNIVFLISFGFVLVVAVWKSKIFQNRSALLLMVFSLIAVIPVISLWNFLSDSVIYHSSMLHSAVVFYLFALILFDRWLSARVSTVFGLLISVIIFNFALMANISYFYLDKCYEQSYYTGSRLMEQIEEVHQENDSVNQIAFIGNREKDVSVSSDFPGNRIHILSSMLESDFFYDHAHAYLFLKETFGLSMLQASNDQIQALEDAPEIDELGIWPAKNSVAVVDNILVIKLEDLF